MENAGFAYVHRSQMQVPVEDLLKGMIVQSGNDATVAVAEAVGADVERFAGTHESTGQSLGHESNPV